MVIPKASDSGYVTQIENHESSSNNEEDLPTKKSVHQKKHTALQKPNNKRPAPGVMTQDQKRKKMIKRGNSDM